jgi:hypothetical protein
MYEGLGLLVHSGWNLDTMSNNIALVYLATSVTFTRNTSNYYAILSLCDSFLLNSNPCHNFYYQTEYIRPVCLANPIEPSYAGEYATVAGWGSTSDGIKGFISPNI